MMIERMKPDAAVFYDGQDMEDRRSYIHMGKHRGRAAVAGPSRPSSLILLVLNINNAHAKKRSPTWPVPWLEANLFPFRPVL